MRRYRPWGKGAWALLLSVFLAALGGCRTQDDAIAASQQMADTAATMQRYYATLDRLLADTEEVQRAQTYLTGVPLDATTLNLLHDSRAEMQKRATLARELSTLAAAFSELTNSGAASDAAKAAAGMNTELVAMKVAPDSSATAAALRVAVATLVSAIRTGNEVKVAKTLDPVLVALCAFFDTEKPVYISVAKSYYLTAASNAGALIDQDQVSTAKRYRTSLSPFGLSPEVTLPALRQAAHDDMRRDVAQKLQQRTDASTEAAEALSEALHRMQERVNVVAKGGTLHLRATPLSLADVKTWIAFVQAQTGDAA